MLIRIVRMTFQPDQVDIFRRLFAESSPHIRNFPGCRHLELLQDTTHPHVFYTYSHWQSGEALATYRRSNLFRTTWAQTKRLFADQPQAFSSVLIENVNGEQ